jgi:ketosteroid isomerase-like protein
MPWFPDFVSAVELARRDTRSTGQADPVGRYFSALNSGQTDELETIWPGEIVVYDPRAGEVRGHRALRRFVKRNQAWLAELAATTERVASTVSGDRAVVELLAHLVLDGQEVPWPLATVGAEHHRPIVGAFGDDCQWPVDGRRHLRPLILEAGEARPGDVVGRYQAALRAGDVDAVVSAFEPDGYFREPIGPHLLHRGSDELRSFFSRCFSAGGGIDLENCAVTDDEVRCALEYNCVRWGRHDLSPQAGVAIFERSVDGLLAAVRIYDDVVAPVDQP